MTKNVLEDQKYSLLEYLSIYSIGLYIITLLIFSYSVELNIVSRMAFLLMAGCCVLYILERAQNKFNSKAIVWVFSLLLLSVFSIAWSLDSSFAFSKVLTVAQLVVLFICVYLTVDNRKKLNSIINFIIIASYFMYFYMFLTLGYENTISLFEEGVRVGGNVNQENTFGYYSVIAFVFSMYQLIYNKKKFYVILLPLPLIMGLMSGSKKALLLFIVVILFLIILNQRRHVMKRTILCVGVLIGVGVILYEIGLLDLVVRRFEDALSGTDDSTNIRKDYIAFGWQKFLESPIWGYGIEHFEILYSQEYSIKSPSHNNYIQLLTSFGLLGVILWYGAYLKFLKDGLRNFFKNNLAPLLTLLVIIMLINDITTTTLLNKFTYIILAICFSIMIVIKKEEKLNKNNE